MYDVELSGCFRDKIFYTMPFDKTPRLNIDNNPLILVLDPSSSQTGIALGTSDGELLMFQDFKNLTLNKAEFTTYLNDYLIRLCRANCITQMVYEVTYDRTRGDAASVVLSNLEDNFKTYSRIIPTLNKSDMFPILPGVWRKNFLKSKEYAGMRKERQLLKEATRKECNKRYPQYYEYFFKTTAPPDSTDAIGIYHGFLEEYWWDKPNNIKRVSKVNSRYSRNHLYTHQVVALPIKTAIKYAAEQNSTINIELYAYNHELSIMENMEIVTAQTNKTSIIFALDPTSTSLLRWSVEYGNAELNSSICAVICTRTNRRSNGN